MDLTCPKCKSETTQKLSLIHSLGVSKTSAIGAGMAGGGVGVGVSTGISTTNLAEKCAPPKAKTFALFWLLLFFAFIFWASDLLIASLICSVLAMLSFRSCAKYNSKVLPGEIDAWNKKYLCLRCENIFSQE